MASTPLSMTICLQEIYGNIFCGIYAFYIRSLFAVDDDFAGVALASRD